MFSPQSGLWLTRVLKSSSRISNWEKCYISCECSIWHTPLFSDEIFLLHPFIESSLSSFLSTLFQHVRWPDVFVPFIVVLEVDECMRDRLCGHSIFAFPIEVSYFCYRSFWICMISDSDGSLWNPVITALPWFWSPCAPLGSSLLFSHFSSMSEIFPYSRFFHWFVCFCRLLLFSFSQWLLSSSHGAVFRLIPWLTAEMCPSSRRFFLSGFPSFLLICWLRRFFVRTLILRSTNSNCIVCGMSHRRRRCQLLGVYLTNRWRLSCFFVLGLNVVLSWFGVLSMLLVLSSRVSRWRLWFISFTLTLLLRWRVM